ncbi:helix-turn-helix domain-containing protein [Bacteroides luti]|uniref:helix-turn-helix domain-containing protein n=1 Tax=Bacteroides luti TaxID=1297750 RepID=UPI000934B2EC|nr:helix-turn-helix domain-containing protein [Bacteroides luti]
MDEAKLILLLSDGGRHSVIEIVKRLFIVDPRAVIRNIRNRGVNVSDEWVKTPSGKKYKLYWIDQKRPEYYGDELHRTD